MLPRHGQGHRLNPSEVNYRANIRALHKQGCTHLLAATCCGSLRQDYAPGDLVLLDSFIDRTTKRAQTFHDQHSANQSKEFGTVCHIPMHPSFCTETRRVIIEAAKTLPQDLKETGLFTFFQHWPATNGPNWPSFFSTFTEKLYESR